MSMSSDKRMNRPAMFYGNWPYLRRYLGLIACFALTLSLGRSAVAGRADIAITDTSSFHVHHLRQPFSVKVNIKYAGSGEVRYHWEDYMGRRLSKSVVINPGTSTIKSAARPIGYYGLVFEATDTLVLPHRRAGEAREYGFAVLPPRTVTDRALDPASPFGVVQVDLNDPYLGGWSKTTTWQSDRSSQNRSYVDASKWHDRIKRRREAGFKELPLILGKPWDWNDRRPVTAQRLKLIKSLAKQYFRADQNEYVLKWEVGIEENNSAGYRQRYYWHNLAAKVGAVRQAADQVNPQIKLIYQVAGLNTEDINNFLSSKAAKIYDILSLHPYAWPDFPAPETWMAHYLSKTREYMQKNGLGNMPIWFTEVGAPQQGNCPGCFFGYPKKGVQDKGLSPEREAAYMIKVHVLALEHGVKRIFWYNYRDRGARRAYAEDHFGLRDYWGFPKPVYAAYFNLRNKVKDKSPAGLQRLADDVWLSVFKGEGQDLLVAWTYPRSGADVSWSSLREDLSREQVAEVTNTVGTPVSTSSNGVHLSRQPVFIVVPHAR